MNVAMFSPLVAGGAVCAGLLGALTGLGGGLIIVPMLTLLFHVDIRYAIGALVGASLAGFVPTSALAMLFGVVLLYSAYQSLQSRAEHVLSDRPDKWALLFRLDSTYPTDHGLQPYSVQGVPPGMALMFVAGILSALLGIGSGIIKVLAMDHAMKLPFKVSTTTSNFMIGVTAAASAGIYLHAGYIDPAIAFPVMLGVLVGALLGARLLTRVRTSLLRWLFTVVVVVMAVEMLYKGITGVI